MSGDPDRLIDVDEAAALLALPRQRISALVRDGELPHIRLEHTGRSRRRSLLAVGERVRPRATHWRQHLSERRGLEERDEA